MMTLTNLVSSFAMGTAILLGQQIGCGERKKGGRTVGTAIVKATPHSLAARDDPTAERRIEQNQERGMNHEEGYAFT